MFSRREWFYLHVHANVAISFSRILLPTTTTYWSLTSFLLYFCGADLLSYGAPPTRARRSSARNELKGNKNYFELAGTSSYRG